jgi:hypothetical protein
MVFGRRAVDYPYGLWGAKPDDRHLILDTSIGAHVWRRDGHDARVAGVVLTLAGIVFPVCLIEDEPPWPLIQRMLRWREIHAARTLDQIGHRAGVVIDLDWTAIGGSKRRGRRSDTKAPAPLAAGPTGVLGGTP